MKDQPIDLDQSFEPQGKKTRKRKIVQPIIHSRKTRRGHQKNSSDECPLPQIIPQSEGSQLIFYQSFDLQVTRLVLQIPFPLFTTDAFKLLETTRVEATPIEIQISLESGNIVCQIKMVGSKDEQSTLIVHGKYSYLSENEVTTKVIKSSRRVLKAQKYAQIVRFKVSEPKSDVFIALSLSWQQELCKLYRGLVNQGNTCYMNSYLQMLFHLTQFRKILFAAHVKEKDKFPATLQLLFFKMLSQEEKPYVHSDGRRSKFKFSKMHSNLAACFSMLQSARLGTYLGVGGEASLICSAVNSSTIYNAAMWVLTQNRQRFYDLQLPIANTLAAALDDYVGEQILEGENSYRTDIYGLQKAHKGLKLSYLPPVLMLQLKRFQFNPYTEANQKILDKCSYPQKMQFSRWTLDPTHERVYELYAVLVHEGSQASSGHYYVFINLQGRWFRFNDQRVQLVQKARAFDYNYGGASDIVEYDAKQMKVVQKQVPNKSTAYMLVYVSKDCKKELIQQKNSIPQWLIEHTRHKLSLDQQKKIRKQSICDIPIFHWEKCLQSKECSGSGIQFHVDQFGPQQKIHTIPKNQKMEEWIEQLEKKQEGKYLYLLWNSMQKQILVNIRSRTCTFVSQLFKDIAEPMLLYTDVNIEKDQFLVIVKFYHPLAEPKFIYKKCLKIKKESSKGDLYTLLSGLCSQSPLNVYIEDKKDGLAKIAADDDSLLPSPSPSKNQLLIAVVEQLIQDEAEGVSKLYQDEKDSVQVYFRAEDRKQGFELQLTKHTTVQLLRDIIFSEIQQEYEEYKSPQNIMFKYKTKRNGKANTEAKDDSLLEDLIKIDKTIVFCYSNLSASDRHRLKEITFHCRDQNLRLSQPIKLVIQRSEEDKLLELVQNNEKINTLLMKEKGYQFRCFLLGRDRSYITDIIEPSGRIIGKGDLATVLARDRNSILVVELNPVEQSIQEDKVNVVIHHSTKTSQRFGCPRIFSVARSMTLSALRGFLLEKIEEQTYQFEGKTYNFNPFKLRFVAYAKDINKGFDLPESKEMMVQDQPKGDSKEPEPTETIDSKFPKNRIFRVVVIHNYISKGSQVLKLNVE